MIKNHIHGQWVSSQNSESMIKIVNPATKECLGETPKGCQEDVIAAVEAADNAFYKWRQTPASSRIQPLFKMKQLLEDHMDSLSESITVEHGKTLVESRGSVRRAIQMVETAAGIPSLMMGKHFEDIAPGIDSWSTRKPMGVFTAIVPFNFPAMVPFWFWPFAVACGNTFVLKASERVPLTSLRVFDLIEKAGFPKGVMNLVHGGKEVVNALCTHPKVKGVSFVGSTPVAEHVYQTASRSYKRVQALGGAKNLMVAMPDAMTGPLKEKSIATAVESIIGCAGERCLAGSLVLSVGKEAYQSFQEGAVRLAKAVRVGNGLDSNTDMGPLISQESKDRVCQLISNACEEGARLLFDGREGVDQLPGYFLRPTVLANVSKEMQIAQEEVFGPVILLSQVDSLDEAIQWINHLPYANTTTLFTRSGACARQFAYEVDPSMIGINIGVPAPMSFFSFGGSKASFFGDIKAHGSECIHFYTEASTVIQRWSDESGIW